MSLLLVLLFEATSSCLSRQIQSRKIWSSHSPNSDGKVTASGGEDDMQQGEISSDLVSNPPGAPARSGVQGELKPHKMQEHEITQL